MTDSENGTTCMWVRRVAELAIFHEKQFHACNNTEIETKTETVLGQANIHVNNNKRSLKSSKQYSHKWKHKKQQNCNRRHEKRVYTKQLSWMFRQLLDVIWDVKAARLMWGIISVAFGLWVLITSRLWCACYKSRESDTSWEVYEMILACNLQLLEKYPWNKGCLCMFRWEKHPMHES